MYGYIYKTTDKKNGKIYIGQHTSYEFCGYSYIGSGKIITDIIKSMKNKNQPLESRFDIELLDTAESKEELNHKEKEYIKLFESTDSNIGYNLTDGGDGGDTVSGTIVITNGDINTRWDGVGNIPDGFYIGSKMCGDKHPMYGLKFKWINNGTEETLIPLNQELPENWKLGRLPMKDEQRKKLSEYRKKHPVKFTEKGLENIRKVWAGDNNPNRKNPKFGKANSFYGKHHSEESKRINSEKHKIKYKCPYCSFVSNHSWITRHINKCHEELIKSASTIESIIYEKYIDE